MNKTLILTKGDSVEINHIIKKNKNTDIIALDFESHKKLEQLNIQHISFENFLDGEDFEKIDEYALKLNSNWYKFSSIEKMLTIKGISLGWLLEQEFFVYLLPTITNFMSLMKIKKQKTIFENIFVPSELFEMASKIFSDSKIFKMNSKKNHELFNFDKYSIKYNIGPLPIKIRISRKTFFKIQKFYEQFFLSFYNKFFSKIQKNNPSVLLIDFNPAREDEFFKYLNKTNNNIFLLNRRRSAIWNIKSFKIVKDTKSIPLSYQKFLKSKDRDEIVKENKEIEKKLNLLFSDKELFSEIFSIEGISFWDHLEKYFKKFCRIRFEEAISEIIGSKKLLSNVKPNKILHFFGVSLQEKIIINEAKKQGIDCIMLQHGAPYIFSKNWSKLNSVAGTLPLHNEKIAVWGEMMKTYAKENGMKDEDIVISGSIRHDSYFKKNMIQEKNDIILVALMPYIVHHSHDLSISEYQKFEKSAETLCKILKKIKNKEIIFKLHPADLGFNSKIMESIISKYFSSSNIIIEADLTKIIPAAEIVVTLGLTTFLLDSNVFKKPTISMLYKHDEILTELSHGYSKVFEYTEDIKFEKYLQELLNNQDIKNSNIEEGQKFVKSYLSYQGNASKTIIEKIFKK